MTDSNNPTGIQTKEVSLYDKDGNVYDESNLLPVKILSPLEASGAVPVILQDQTTEIIDLHFLKDTGTWTLASNTTSGDLSLAATSGHGIQVGDTLQFNEEDHVMQADVLSVVTDTIGIDSPIDFAFTTSAVCSKNDHNAAVDGSSAPVIFEVSPKDLQAGTRWDITRVIYVIEDQTVMDTAKFGGISALTKGVVLQINNNVNKNLGNFKSNGDFAMHAFDVNYDDKAPSGFYAVRIRSTYGGQSKRGVVIRLAADDNDMLRIIIQDDLTNLDDFHIVAQGHTVTD